MPALGRFCRVWSLGFGLEPCAQFHRHGGEKLPLFYALPQMFPIGFTTRVSGWPDFAGRHTLADSVYNLGRNALRLCRTRPSFLEAGVKFSQSFLLRGWRFAAPIGGRHACATARSLFRSCHVSILAKGSWDRKSIRHANRKRPRSFLNVALI